jgi:ribosomal protein S18 acetylase RimI-like enzyme
MEMANQSKIEIVKLTSSDWQEYRAIRLRSLKEDPQAFGANYQSNFEYPEEEWKRRLENASKGEKNWLLFAKEGDKFVGMIGAFLEDGATDTATIVSVYVPIEERGKGVSNKLMDGILKELSQKDFLKKVKLAVNKDQKSAVSLYKKFEFEEIGVQYFKMGNGELADELMMERQLPYSPLFNG